MTVSTERCCFEFCEQPATHKAGGAVYFPMCAAHWLEHRAMRTVVSFDPMHPKYQNTVTGRMLTSGWLAFDCGHAYQWHPHGLTDDKSEPKAGEREMCAICLQDALSAAAIA